MGPGLWYDGVTPEIASACDGCQRTAPSHPAVRRVLYRASGLIACDLIHSASVPSRARTSTQTRSAI